GRSAGGRARPGRCGPTPPPPSPARSDRPPSGVLHPPPPTLSSPQIRTVRPRPESRGERDGLEPRLVHGVQLDLVGGTRGEEVTDGDGDRNDQREQVAQRDVTRR